MDRLRNEQARSQAPEDAEKYQLLLLDFFDTAISVYRRVVAGDRPEAERHYATLLELEPRVAEAEAEYNAPCVTGGI